MKRINDRGVEGTFFPGEHLKLFDLKKKNIEHGYLNKNITAYPKFVEFRIRNVSHVTGRHGLEGIFKNVGFRQPSDKSRLLWWELSITADDIHSAEQNFLTSCFSRTQIGSQLPFREHFTSKAFQKESPYGNFRFTFSFRELLHHYGAKFCPDGLVLRVYETVLYRQEILYSIIVHPRKIHCYDDYPRLPDAGYGVCGYDDGSIWWRCQAPSDTYMHRPNETPHVSPHNKLYFVWDHVCVAFHMEPGWVLHVNQDELFNRLNVCKVSAPCLLRPPEIPLSLHEAENMLVNLKARMGDAGV